MSIIKIKISDR